MTNSNPLQFADAYARFKNDLEGVTGSTANLSQRGLVNALLTVFRELQHDPDPVAAISEAIHAYYECEREDREEDRAQLAAERRQYAEWVAAETRVRKAECPSCSAKPGDVCHRPNGRPAPESHRSRYRTAGQLVDAGHVPAP